MTDVSEIKQRARGMWAAGNYDAVAELIWDVGDRIVRRVDVRAGEDVLDVACGTGNAAIRAAAAGGRTVGVDLTPELFVVARTRAEEAGVAVEWVTGDAEELPFEDESFDVVLSTFGCMFAPRHDVTARELARVLRPGGRLGLCNWTPEGTIGRFFATVASHLPPPPSPPAPPPLWGDEQHVRELYAGTGVEPAFEREHVDFRFASADAAVEYYTTNFGVLVQAREALAPDAWQALHDDLRAMYAEHSDPGTGKTRFAGEYLVALGVKR